LPSTAEDLLALPWIGRSTAGAIRALGFGQRAAILDGNVKRVLTRHHAVAGWPDAPAVQRTLWQLAEEHTPVVRVADYTQAIMDLGATLCTRAQPRCGDCPLRETCAARRADAVANYPAPRPRRALPVRATHFLVLVDTHGAVLLERRPPNGVWGGLWSFPELSDVAEHYAWCAERGLVPQGTMRALPVLEHGFTHFKLTITPWCETVTMRGATCMDSDRWLWYNAAAPARIGLAKPVATILSALSTAPS
jgi:A/G-specific adenine glycosylase